METVYPNFVADNFSDALKECESMVKDLRYETFGDRETLHFNVSYRGFVEVLGVAHSINLDSFKPSKSVNYSIRKFFSKFQPLNLEQDNVFVNLFMTFIRKRQLKAADLCCRNTYRKDFIAEALIKSLDYGVLDFFLDKEYTMDRYFMSCILKRAVNIKSYKLHEKLLRHFIKLKAKLNMDDYDKWLLLSTLWKVEQFDLLKELIQGKYELYFSEELVIKLTSLVFKLRDGLHYPDYLYKSDLIRQLFLRFGPKRTKIDQELINAINYGINVKSSLISQACPEIFQDIETIKIIITSSFRNRVLRSGLRFLRTHCTAELFDQAIHQIKESSDIQVSIDLDNAIESLHKVKKW